MNPISEVRGPHGLMATCMGRSTDHMPGRVAAALSDWIARTPPAALRLGVVLLCAGFWVLVVMKVIL